MSKSNDAATKEKTKDKEEKGVEEKSDSKGIHPTPASPSSKSSNNPENVIKENTDNHSVEKEEKETEKVDKEKGQAKRKGEGTSSTADLDDGARFAWSAPPSLSSINSMI